MNRSRTAGLALLGLLSVADLAGPLTTDGKHPPMEVALVGAVIGLVSLVLVGYAWKGSTRAIAPLAVLRVLSALTALPAFFVDGVPAAIQALVVVFAVLTVAGVALVVRPAPMREVAVR
ncbi:hypothetical protein [Nocardioides sp. MH1]|uniref:hypothetical protein n=1 Tax=Nocardioides sp. MH1 TaxID=3242490 RepID=UPI0035216289